MAKFGFTRQRLLIIGGGVILLIMGIIYRFSPLFTEFYSGNEAMALKKKQLVAYQKRLETASGLETTREEVIAKLRIAEAGLLTGDTPALAAVDIQNTIRQIADQLGIQIQTFEVLKTDADESTSYIQVPVRFVFRSSIRQAIDAFYRIESSPKLLILTAMKISDENRMQPGQIKVTLTLSGLMAKEKSLSG